MPRGPRSTPHGEHRPVLLQEVLEVLSPQEGEIAVDCTTGWAGHSVELLQRIGPRGHLLGLDFDAENLPRARERLLQVGESFSLHHSNFAALPSILAEQKIDQVDMILADLGMSSMQVDDAERGFSYVREGPLDMRMDRSRGRSAAQLLATIGEEELRQALEELGDEPEAARFAAAIVAARQRAPIERTTQLARLLLEVSQPGQADPRWRLHPRPGKWQTHPAARTFQVLRILVNRELNNLEQLLRVAPSCLRPRGRLAIISFHSGEDRRVKQALRQGEQRGEYGRIAAEPLRAGYEERQSNPRARSAKLRWAIRSDSP